MFVEKRFRTRTLFNYRKLRLNARARLAGVYLETPVLLITGGNGSLRCTELDDVRFRL